MLFPALSQGLFVSSARLCRQCLQARAALRVPAMTCKRQFSRRILKRAEKAELVQNNKEKYLNKMRAAQAEWDARAERIKQGKERNVWDILEERGFVKDVAGSRNTIQELFRTRRIGAYVGIDPTAPSLHIGHLLPMMPLFWMYMHGYTAISLIGGATAKIGDPTGRLQSRQAMSKAELTANMTKIHYQLKQLWVNVEQKASQNGYKRDWAWKRGIDNNNTWWNRQPWLEILRRVGTSMRVGPMLGRDTVKTKMTKGDGVSFAEFSYPIMQGWDWWMLLNRYNVQMQIGGSDQFGNIISGIEVVKSARATETQPADKLPAESALDDPVGFTVPLLTDKAGNKFGKSAGNAIWLDPVDTSIFDLYGYFVRRPDDEIETLLKLFTFVPLDEIQRAMETHKADPSKRVAHHLLAYEVCSLIHGGVAARRTQKEHNDMYGRKDELAESPDTSSPTADDYVPEDDRRVTPNTAPRIDMILPKSLILGKSIPKILYAARLTSSTSEGRRGSTGRGVYIGASPGKRAGDKKQMSFGHLEYSPISTWNTQYTSKYLIDDHLLILRKGKHNVRIIKVVDDKEYAASGQTYPGMLGTGQLRTMKNKLRLLRKELKAAAAAAEKSALDGTESNEDDATIAEAESHTQTGAEAETPTIEFPSRNRHTRRRASQMDEMRQEISKLEKQIAQLEETSESPAGESERSLESERPLEGKE